MTLAEPICRIRMSTAQPATTTIDRLPPHSPEAEQGVLGCVLLSSDCIAECIETLREDGAFYDLRHQTIYNAMLAMFDAREPIDIITLRQRLKNALQLDEVGGTAYLSSLIDTVPSAANLPSYLSIVHEKHLLRKVIHTCTAAVGRVYGYQGEVTRLLDDVESDILSISISRSSSKSKTMRVAVADAINTIERYHQKIDCGDVFTGLVDLDRATHGLHKGEVVILAARPSIGKTSLAMNIAERVAIDDGLPVGVFSMEMAHEALTLRLLCSRAKVDSSKIRDGYLSGNDFVALSRVAPQIAAAPLHIDDTSGLSVTQLCAKARRMAQMHGIRLFVVDYLQLISAGGRRNDSRQQDITAISAALKGLAGELKVPFLVLSQLNRDVEKDGKNRKPRSSDLRESGSLEQDADGVWLLWCPDEKEPAAINLEIAKQRSGPRDVTVGLTFLRESTRFESRAKISSADVPYQQN